MEEFKNFVQVRMCCNTMIVTAVASLEEDKNATAEDLVNAVLQQC